MMNVLHNKLIKDFLMAIIYYFILKKNNGKQNKQRLSIKV